MICSVLYWRRELHGQADVNINIKTLNIFLKDNLYHIHCPCVLVVNKLAMSEIIGFGSVCLLLLTLVLATFVIRNTIVFCRIDVLV